MVEVEKSVKRKKTPQSISNVRQRALVHNANERARYRSIKEQMMVLSLHVPGRDKESVHNTLGRIRLFNRSLEYLNCKLENQDLGRFTVEERLAFSTFLSNNSDKVIGAFTDEGRDLTGRPHVVRFDSSLKTRNDDNNSRAYSCIGSNHNDTVRCPNLIKVSHKTSKLSAANTDSLGQESVTKIIDEGSKNVERKILSNVIGNKRNSDGKFSKDEMGTPEIATSSDLDVVILKYQKCHLYLKDYEKENLQDRIKTLTGLEESNFSCVETQNQFGGENSNANDHSEQLLADQPRNSCVADFSATSQLMLDESESNIPTSRSTVSHFFYCKEPTVINPANADGKPDGKGSQLLEPYQSRVSVVTDEIPVVNFKESKCNANGIEKSVNKFSQNPKGNVASSQLLASDHSRKMPLSSVELSDPERMICKRPRRHCQRKKCFYDSCCTASFKASVGAVTTRVSNLLNVSSCKRRNKCNSSPVVDPHKSAYKKMRRGGYEDVQSFVPAIENIPLDWNCGRVKAKKKMSSVSHSISNLDKCQVVKDSMLTSKKSVRGAVMKFSDVSAKKKGIAHDHHLRGRKFLAELTNNSRQPT